MAVAAADNLLLTPDEFDKLEARQNLHRTMGRVHCVESGRPPPRACFVGHFSAPDPS